MVAHLPGNFDGDAKGQTHHTDGERLADELEHLFDRQDQLMKQAHLEYERLTKALRELATAIEREHQAPSEPHQPAFGGENSSPK